MSDTKVKLKLVDGDRYALPSVSEDVILKGGTISVTRAQADALLGESWDDASNNTHFYFEEIEGDDEAAEDAVDDAEGDTDPEAVAAKELKAAQKKAAQSRSRTKAAPK